MSAVTEPTPLDDGVRNAAILRAVQQLQPFAEEDESGVIQELIDALSDRLTDQAETALEKAMVEMVDLRKRAADIDPESRQRVEGAARSLQAEYLAKHSPAGHAAWVAARQAAGHKV